MALLVLIPPIAQAIAAAATAVIGMAIGIGGGQVAIDEGKKANAEADKTLSKQSPTATGECPPGIGHNGGPPLDEAPVGEAPPAEAPPAPTNPAAGPSGSDPKPNNSNPDNPTAGGPAGQPSGAPAFTNSAEDRARQGREKLKRDAEESGHGGFGTRSPKEDPKKKMVVGMATEVTQGGRQMIPELTPSPVARPFSSTMDIQIFRLTPSIRWTSVNSEIPEHFHNE